MTIQNSYKIIQILIVFLLPIMANAHEKMRLEDLGAMPARVAYCASLSGVELRYIGNDAQKMMSVMSSSQAWQTELNHFLSDSTDRNFAIRDAIIHFNDHVKQLMAIKHISKPQAEEKILRQDMVACKKLVNKLSDLPDDKKIVQQWVFPVNAAATAVTPVFWQMNIKPTSGTLVDNVYLSLWEMQKGVKEGVVALVKNKNRCFARIVLRKGSIKGVENSFKSFAGEGCEEFDGGHFEYVLPPKTGARQFNIIWKPRGLKLKTFEAAIQLQKTNQIGVGLIKTPPEFLQKHIVAYQTNQQLAEEKLPAQIIDFQKLSRQLKQAAESHFDESKLIGVWKGQLISRKQAIPVEIAIWPAKPSRFQTLVGVASFPETQCTAGVVFGRGKGELTLGMTRLTVSNLGEKCDRVEGEASLRMRTTGDALQIYFIASKGCFAAGVFKRAAASQKLRQTIKIARWPYSAPPAVQTWLAIRDNKTALLASIKQAHMKAMAGNAATAKQIKQENKAERQALAVAARREIEQEKQQKIDSKQSQQRLTTLRQEQAADKGYIEPKVISGPFDGIEGASFLNAVYQGNASAVHQQSRAYQLNKYRQIKMAMGNQPHWSDNIIKGAFDKVNMLNILYAMYLFNYQTYYGSCLGDDAVKFIVTVTRPEVTTTNLLGIEVAHQFASQTSTEYKVNPEFVDIFRRIGRMKPNNASMKVVDFLVGGGRFNISQNSNSNGKGKLDLRNQVIAGTRQLMQAFSCDSAEIKQFEKNMLTVDR